MYVNKSNDNNDCNKEPPTDEFNKVLPKVHKVTEGEGRNGGHGESADGEEDVDGHRAGVDGSVQQDHVRQDQVRQGGVQERLGAQVQQAQGRLGPKAGQAEEAPVKEKLTSVTD